MEHDKAELCKFDKTESEEQELKKFYKRKKFIEISSTLSLVIFIVTALVVIHYFWKVEKIPEHIPTESGNDSDNHLGEHQMFDRTKWNGKPTLSYRNITSPVPMIIIKQTGGKMCYSFEACASKLRCIQSDCINRGMPDISSSFFIDLDGNIYVGRGWDVQPQQRDNIIDLVFVGSFTTYNVTSAMIDSARLLIADGAKKNKLTKNYKIVAHNQTAFTESPGERVIQEIRKWPHYDSGYYFSNEVLANSTDYVC